MLFESAILFVSIKYDNYTKEWAAQSTLLYWQRKKQTDMRKGLVYEQKRRI